MNRLSIRALTWLTLVAALGSALLLAFEDNDLPEMARNSAQAIQLPR